MHKINTIFLSLIIFSLNSFAQIIEEEYNREKDELNIRRDQLKNEIAEIKFEIDSMRNRIPELKEELITAYRELYVLKYGNEIGQRIASKQIWKGMTDEMVRDGWGEPDRINNNVERWGTFTQWTYGNIIFFFRDGNLTDWEEGRIE